MLGIGSWVLTTYTLISKAPGTRLSVAESDRDISRIRRAMQACSRARLSARVP